METELADQEQQRGSPTTTPTNDSSDSETEHSDDRELIATPTTATAGKLQVRTIYSAVGVCKRVFGMYSRLQCICTGSSAQEETPTQPSQGEQEENESTTSSGSYSYRELHGS